MAFFAGSAAGRVDGAAFGFVWRTKPPPSAAVAVAVATLDPRSSSAAVPTANR
ncbi:hypothetical protein ACWC2T_26300 [Streptomyces sp. NPDC001393]